MLFEEAVNQILEATDKKFEQWKDEVAQIYKENPKEKLWNIPDAPIRFKSKNLKASGISSNGQSNNIKKRLLTFLDYEVTETTDMIKDSESNWKKVNKKKYYIEYPKRVQKVAKTEGKTVYKLSDVKDTINRYEKILIKNEIR